MPTAAGPATSRRARWREPFTAAALFIVVRALGVAVLYWYANAHNGSLSDTLTKWDSNWFIAIATDGYHAMPRELVDAFGNHTDSTGLAFFPGYPLLVAAVAWLPWVSVFGAALGVNVVSGVVAAVGLARLSTNVGASPRVGLLMVVLFAAAPMGVVLSMAYSEALFCALAVWALNGVLERQWLLAGACAALAGLVRPTAAALVLAVSLAAAVALLRRRDGWSPWVAVVLAPLGLLGYLVWVGWQTGSVFGWFHLQSSGWHSGFDGGAANWHYLVQQFEKPGQFMEVASVLIVLAVLVLAVLSVVARLPWPVLVYGVGVTVMAVTSNGLMPSKPRLLLPAVVLALPVAFGLADRRLGTQLAVGVGIVGASAWFGAYALVVYPYAM
ncbi:MAG: mannosyltransferase family protein [Mycobacteriaceae bacterium]